MIERRTLLMGGVAFGAFIAARPGRAGTMTTDTATTREVDWRKLTDAEWRKRLKPQQYEVLRQEGTEAPGSSPLNQEKRKGIYHCAGCELALFSSDTKFHSGTGWPSFYKPLPNAVGTKTDRSFLTSRTEVHCARCLGHLGHVFHDGPPPTGLRYCMNGVAMTFVPASGANS
jgi:peptide-methionine (R)-S-oxide reductase